MHLGTLRELFAQPVGNVSEYVAAVFLGAEEDLVALQPLDLEQRHIRYAKAGVGERPDEVLRLFAGPGPLPLLVDPPDGAERVASGDDPSSSTSVKGILFATRLAPSGGFRSLLTGFSGSHLRFMQNRKKERSVPSRLALARTPSFKPL